MTEFFVRVGRRLRQIARFAAAGSTLPDKFKMGVIGYARGHTFDSPGLTSQIGRSIFPSVKVRTRSLGGLTICLSPSDLSHLVALDEVLIERVYRLEKVPFRPDVVIDCGANIGVFTLLAVATFPKAKVIAFEPDPENFAWLGKQRSANELPRLQILEAAVSDTSGETRFAAGLGIGSSLVSSGTVNGSLITVKTVRLSSFLQEARAERLVLKLDVEGSEEQVVPDIVNVLPVQTALFFETHRGDESWDTLSRMLMDAGFEVSRQRMHGPYCEGYAIRTREMKK